MPEGLGDRTGAKVRPTWAKGLRIAIVNWRDADHPQAGGAETYCMAVARWLAEEGAQVNLVTSRAPGQERRSTANGIEIHRGGGQFGVYPFVLLWLLGRRLSARLGRRAPIDAVLDCQNGIPFFSSLAVGRRVPVVLLIHHVHQDQFAQHFGKRLAKVGRFLEGPVSRAVYARRPTICVSPSTRAEVRTSLRFRTPIYVVPNGSPQAPTVERRPSAHPSVVSVGRLVVQKGTDELLVAVAEARRAIPDLVFHVVGDGPELPALREQAQELGLDGAVIFHGRVSDEERDAILDQAWIFLSASQREGWGVAVLEAAARGIPALARNVPGLRDAVRDGITGWLVNPEQPFSESLVSAIGALKDPAVSTAMAEDCAGWAQNFSWDRSAQRVAAILEHEWVRLQSGQRMRHVPDLVIRVEVESAPLASHADTSLFGSRLTDEWRRMDDRLVGLLYGTDEHGARQALVRLGLDPEAQMRVARSQDLLGELPRRSGPRPIAAIGTGPTDANENRGDNAGA